MFVAPCAGAWVEIEDIKSGGAPIDVAPCAGAWVEISIGRYSPTAAASPPVRGRGLKYHLPVNDRDVVGRPLCGGVG